MLFSKMKRALQAWDARRAALKAEQKRLAARWEYWVSTGIVKLQKKQK